MQNKWYNIARQNEKTLTKESDNYFDKLKYLGLGAGIGAGISTGFIGSNMHQDKMQDMNTSPNKIELRQNNFPQENTKNVSNKQDQPTINSNPEKIEQKNTEPQASDEELKSFISFWEGGPRKEAYRDSKGIWTIAIGFNLERSDADKILAQIGANKKDLISHKTSLNNEQMDKLFEINLKTAIADAKKWIPNLSSQPKEVQKICIDMSFNMGISTLSDFKTTAKYIINKNYAAAASRLEKTAWYNQVGRRSKNHIKTLRDLAKQSDLAQKGK